MGVGFRFSQLDFGVQEPYPEIFGIFPFIVPGGNEREEAVQEFVIGFPLGAFQFREFLARLREYLYRCIRHYTLMDNWLYKGFGLGKIGLASAEI